MTPAKYYRQRKNEKGRALCALDDRRVFNVLGMLLQDSLQAEEKDQGEEGAKPDFQNDHASTPARKATQRNQTQATASPLPNAHRLPLTM